MPVSGIQNSDDRNYSGLINSAGSDTSKTENLAEKYGIKYTNGDNGTLTIQDFFTLMITQLKNQDFTNPTSDTEYMAQLTQYSSMQAMQEMSKFTQQNYALSLVGKNVTASKYENGSVVNETGTVEQLVISKNEYYVKVNGKTFTLGQIGVVGTPPSTSTDKNDQGNSTTDKPADKLDTDKDAIQNALG